MPASRSFARRLALAPRAQYSPDVLLSYEQISAGNYTVGRGYDPGTLTGDSVFGVSTDMCVSTTVRVGANLGYRVIVVGDACDCFDLPDGEGGTIPAETVHRTHLATLGFEFATVVPAATFAPA